MIRRREFMRKRTVVRITGGARIAKVTATEILRPDAVMPKTKPANTVGDVATIKQDMLTTKLVISAIGIVPIATAVRVTLQMRNPSVNTRGIAPIVNTGIRSPMVVQRGGTAPSATMKTRYVRLQARRIAIIRGTARRVKKGIYLQNRVRKVTGTAKLVTRFIILPAETRSFRTIIRGTVISMKIIPVAKSDI